ncbi:hypothetical protein V8E53_001840 [Lactarius tabidus]
MSQVRDEATNVQPNAEFATGNEQYPPQCARNQASQPEAQSGFIDGSGPIFSMYMEMAEGEDKKTTESWKADADSILVFTSLFSASVATLLSVSIQDLRQDPQDTSNFYIANIYQLLADPDRSNILTSLPLSPPPFSPPSFAVWVNGLWFMSLVISITCAVLVTLLQQWARRYLKKVTQTRYSLDKRARIRAFFAKGVDISALPVVVEALPMLIHISLVLFFAGLAVFLWNVNLTIFKVVLSWIGVCTALYGCTMLTSLVRPDSPYNTPLTPLVLAVAFVVIQLGIFLPFWICVFLLRPCWGCIISRRIPKWMLKCFSHLERMGLMIDHALEPEKAALESPELDARALMWTFRRLDEDHEQLRFFSGLPGFHSSKVLKEPLRTLGDSQKRQILAAIIGFLDRTFSSDLLQDHVKRHRVYICTKAIDVVDIPEAFQGTLRRFAFEVKYRPIQSAETVDFVKRWGNLKGGDMTPLIRALFSIVVARVQQHDDSWFTIASDELAIPESVLRSHAAHGYSLSLAILIHISRQQFIHSRTPSWPLWGISDVLEAESKFDVQDTSPELQHEFCALWNQICMLKPLRSIYLALHHDIISAPTQFSASTYDLDDILRKPTSYPVCCVPDHTLDDSASTTFPRTIVQYHDDALATASLTSPDATFLSLPAPPHVHENLTTVPPLDNPHPTHHTVDGLAISLTSPDPSNAAAIKGAVTAGIATPYPTPEASISPPPQSRHPIPVPDAPSAALVHTSGLDQGNTAAADDGSPISSLRKGKNDLDPPSVYHAVDSNTIPTLILPPKPPSLPSVTDAGVAITGHSSPETSAEHTVDDSSDPSRYQYDMV